MAWKNMKNNVNKDIGIVQSNHNSAESGQLYVMCL